MRKHPFVNSLADCLQAGVFLEKKYDYVRSFEKIDIRVGRIEDVEDFPQAKKPAYKLLIDFGEQIGKKKSSAQLVNHYKKEELIGKLILCVCNFAPKQIGPFVSEVLTLGVPEESGGCVLVGPDKANPVIGGKLY